MRGLRQRGKAFFPGLMAVLVSPTPIRVLCVFGTREAMRAQFFESADQVLRLGQGFRVMASEWSILTPIGSKLMFKDISKPEDTIHLQGIELHDLWIEPTHPIAEAVWERLACRVRL